METVAILGPTLGQPTNNQTQPTINKSALVEEIYKLVLNEMKKQKADKNKDESLGVTCANSPKSWFKPLTY